MVTLQQGKHYYLAVDTEWVPALCVKYSEHKWGFHTPWGLMDSGNARVRVLGLVPEPTGWGKESAG